MNFKEIVKDSYLHIIKGSINRILLFDFDSIINNLIRLHIVVKEDETKINAEELLVITDKFFIVQNLWKSIMETLYENFLPNVDYNFSWKIEITAYTLMLCELSSEHFSSEKELNYLKDLAKLTDDDIENNFQKIKEDLGFQKMGIEDIIESTLPKGKIPSSHKEQLLLFRLMNFPPLREISKFINEYNSTINQNIKSLSIAFTSKLPNLFEGFHKSEPLHYSEVQFSHDTFKNVGFETLSKHKELSEFKDKFENTTKIISFNSGKLKDETICPCCGEKSEVILPDEILQYKMILEDIQLSTKIGLIYYDDFVKKYKETLSDGIANFFPNLNNVYNPDCLILVEGESEEVAIPILAFRKRFILSEQKIQVYNSKSKQKLKEDFFNLKEKYPERKMICLLDSDAIKERDDIQRVVDGNKDKYRLVFISEGTFEDLFDLQESIDIINELYPEGEEITIEEIDTSKDFLTNMKKLLFHKKKAQFDKVLFAKKVSLKIDIDKMPQEIVEILEIAKNFTEDKKFVKK
jgi:hypothetical protein